MIGVFLKPLKGTDMKKALAAVIVSAFAMGAMANTPVNTAGTEVKTPEATTKIVKKVTHKKMKVSHHPKKHTKLSPSPT